MHKVFAFSLVVYSGIAVKTALAVALNAVRRSGTPGTAKPQ